MADPVNQMVTYISSVPGGLRFSCIVSITAHMLQDRDYSVDIRYFLIYEAKKDRMN